MELVASLDKEIEELKKKESEAQEAAKAPAIEETKPEIVPELDAEDEPAEPAKPEGDGVAPAIDGPQQNAAARNRITAKKNAERLTAELDQARLEKQDLALELARLRGAAEASAKPNAEAFQDLEPEYDALDPKPWIDWNNRQHKKELDSVKGEFTTFRQTVAQTQAESAWQDMNKGWQESDEVYANSYTFMKGKLEEAIKEKYPTANAAQVKQLMKQEENLFVGEKANKGIDIRSAFKVLAIESGFNPFEKPASDAAKPASKTIPNLAAITEAKKKSGSFIGTSAGGASVKKGSAKDIANATLDELMGFSKEDFRAAVKEARELGERGERL